VSVLGTVKADGSRTTQLTFRFDPAAGKSVPVPIDLGAEQDRASLVLYGTGIRNRSALTAVRVMIGGMPADVEFAGPQSQTPGLDQVNVSLPRALQGRGDVEISLTVDGKSANPTTVRIQ
jgi:uncharacterized protein (TIGR03437 family)